MSELYRFIHAEKANHPIVLLCRTLHVARSSYYAWREGEAARHARQAADDALAHEITVLHIASRRTYGVRRIHAELRRLGRRVNRKRIARVMRERHIQDVTRPYRACCPAPGPAAGIRAPGPGSSRAASRAGPRRADGPRRGPAARAICTGHHTDRECGVIIHRDLPVRLRQLTRQQHGHSPRRGLSPAHL